MSAGSTGQLSDRELHSLVSALGRGEQPRVGLRTAHDDVPAGTRGVLVGYEPDDDPPGTVRVTVDGASRDVRVPTSALAVVPRGRADVIARTQATSTDPDADAGDRPGHRARTTNPVDTTNPDDTTDPGDTTDPDDTTDPGDTTGPHGTAGPDAATGEATAAASDAKATTAYAGAADESTAAGRGTGGPGPDAGRVGAEGERSRGPASADQSEAAAPAKRGRPAKTAAKKTARGGAGDVVITVTVAGDSATVEASHGSRKLVKPTALPVTAGHAVAQAIELAAITDAVEAVIDEHRSAKQAEAEQLRARLAELERELAGYPGGDGAADPDAAVAAS